MYQQNIAIQARGGTALVSERSKHALIAPPAGPTLSQLSEPLLRGEYRELTRKHLGTLLDQLFTDYTGLRFHIAWAPTLGEAWDSLTFPSGCAVCRRLAGRIAPPPGCRICGPRQLARALSANEDGHYFTCRLGVRNYWFPIRVRSVPVGIVYVQALAQKGPRRAATPVLSRSKFLRPGRLLRLIIQHVQTLDLAELRERELTSATNAVAALEKEREQLQKSFKRYFPTATPSQAVFAPQTHDEQIVQRLLQCIAKNCAQPLTLRACAAQLGMNASYLSDVFSRVVGVPFKAYLTEVRLQKARELLSDPRRNLAQVAYAVGYASESRFRIAFKKATGLCPSTWRETFHAVS